MPDGSPNVMILDRGSGGGGAPTTVVGGGSDHTLLILLLLALLGAMAYYQTQLNKPASKPRKHHHHRHHHKHHKHHKKENHAHTMVKVPVVPEVAKPADPDPAATQIKVELSGENKSDKRINVPAAMIANMPVGQPVQVNIKPN